MKNCNLEIYKMRDISDKNTVKKDKLFDLPMRLLLIGKTGQGKSNLLGNLILLPQYYNDDFEGEDIYVFSGSLRGDKKIQTIIKQKDIPPSNIFNDYNEDEISIVYDLLVELYNESISDNEKPKNKLLIFDDLSFS